MAKSSTSASATITTATQSSGSQGEQTVIEGGYTLAEVNKNISAGVTTALPSATAISPTLRSNPEEIDQDVQVLKASLENANARVEALENRLGDFFHNIAKWQENIDTALSGSDNVAGAGETTEPSQADRLATVEGFLKRHFGGMFG